MTEDELRDVRAGASSAIDRARLAGQEAEHKANERAAEAAAQAKPRLT